MAVDMGSAVAYLLLDATNFNTSLQGAANSLTSTGAQMSSAGTRMTTTITKGIISLGQTAVNTTSQFESAMSQVQATKNIGVDALEELNGETVNVMDSLGDLAKELGGSTKYTATEAAEAINNMAMAGYSVQEIYDSLPTVLSLASAGALDLDYATQLVANGLNVMGLETKDAGELADKLATAASNAYGSVSDFGEGLLVAGGQASLANVSLTDTVTALGILGDNGISASEGGTMLRNTLKNLYTPTTDAQKALKKLGVETKTADGQLIDFQEVLKQLDGALDNLTEAERIDYMGRIFDTRTIAGANALINNSSERWDELSGAIDNASGAADRMAKTQLDNLDGQLTILNSSLEALSISFGELIMPVVKDVVGMIQGLVDWLNSLDESQKEMILKIGVLVAAVGPLLIIVGRAIALFGQMQAGLGALGGGMGFVGLKVAVIAGAIVGLIALFTHLYETNEEFRESVQGSFEKLSGAFERFKETFSNIVETLSGSIEVFVQNIAEPLSGLIDTIMESAALILDSIGPSLEGLFETIGKLIEEAPVGGILDSISRVAEVIGGLAAELLPIIIDQISRMLGWLQPVFDLADKILSAFADLAELVAPLIEEIATMVDEVFADLPIEDLLSSVSELVQSILGIIASVMPTVISLMRKVLPIIKSVLDTLAPAFQLLSDIISTIAALLSGDFESAGEGLKSIFDDIIAVIESVWNTITTTFETIGEILSPVTEAIGEALSAVGQFFSDVFTNIGLFFTETIPQWFEDFKAWLDELPEKAGEALGTLLGNIYNFGADCVSWVQNDLPQIINDIIAWFGELPGKIWEWLTTAYDNVVQWGADLYEEMSTAVGDAIDAVVEWFEGLPEDIETWVQSAIDWLDGIDLLQTGKDIFNSLWEGLKSVWDSIVGWFEGLSLNFGKFTSGIGKGFANATGGSYATGLDYVPRTMEVTVHRGERILTQQENEEYNKGGSIEVVTYQNDEAFKTLNGTMLMVYDELKKQAEKQVVLDGKRVVGALVSEIDRQLGINSNRAARVG